MENLKKLKIMFVSFFNQSRRSGGVRQSLQRKKGIRYWQLAPVVVEEGREARTAISCQQCLNERQLQQGEPRLNFWKCRAVGENKGTSWQILENYGKEQLARGIVGLLYSWKGRSEEDS